MRSAFLTRLPSFILALSLFGCSSMDRLVSGDKVDYRSATRETTSPLDVPPDLTQLAKSSRYKSQRGSVSAAAIQSAEPAASGDATVSVAVRELNNARIERLGNERWLSTSMPPEQLWPQLRTFWRENGYTLARDQPALGVMETQWAENRAKLPKDPIRNVIGKVFGSLYSTGERDKFRTRLERTSRGSEVYITHRGMIEVYTDSEKEQTAWQPRPVDRQLETEFLARLLHKLGVKSAKAEAAVAASNDNSIPPRARVLKGRPAATLQVGDSFGRAWRRVGLALDRRGFTVEDRDRARGVYFVRYVDPGQVVRKEPGFFNHLFNSDSEKDKALAPVRYRIRVKGHGNTSTVAVNNSRGAPDDSDIGRRIIAMLLEELK